MKLSIGGQVFVKKGLTRFDPHDPYYFAVSLNWKRFVLMFVVAELALNSLFAGLYMLQPASIANQARPGFLSAFFFSLETLATVGYGEMYPGTLYGHIVASLEILTGTIFTAIMTGLLFVRFSKPKAKVLYATNPVITPNNGTRTLMLRIGNARGSLLQNATASIHVLARTISIEGQQQANVIDLPLARSRIPAFAMMWTLMHPIDEASALHGLDDASIIEARFFITVTARDPAMGQDVSDLHSIDGADIRFGMRYVDAIHRVSNTKTVADFARMSEIEPDGVTSAPPPQDP